MISCCVHERDDASACVPARPYLTFRDRLDTQLSRDQSSRVMVESDRDTYANVQVLSWLLRRHSSDFAFMPLRRGNITVCCTWRE